MTYLEALKKGHEVVVLGGDYDTAIFWMKDGQVYAFSKEMGVFPHPSTPDQLEEHFNNMLKEGLQVSITASENR